MRPCAAGSHIFFRSAMVRELPLTQSFFGLITTVSASNATGISMYLMPALRQASISSVEIGREAFDMSVSPRQNFLKPPPVPDMPTVTRTLPRLEIWNSSANASATGNTVLEPSILIEAWALASPGADGGHDADDKGRYEYFLPQLHGLNPLQVNGHWRSHPDGAQV
jgi:hypothetical protein